MACYLVKHRGNFTFTFHFQVLLQNISRTTSRISATRHTLLCNSDDGISKHVKFFDQTGLRGVFLSRQFSYRMLRMGSAFRVWHFQRW